MADSKSASVESMHPDSTFILASFEASSSNQAGIANITESLICFNLSAIPTDAVVDSAYLLINHTSSTQKSDPTEFLRIIEPWSDKYVTWKTKPQITLENRIIVPFHYHQSLNLNLTDFSKFWVKNPSMNFGMLYRLISETAPQSSIILSGFNSNTAFIPKLKVYYTVNPLKNCICSDNPKPYFITLDSILASNSVSFHPDSDSYVCSLFPDKAYYNSNKLLTGIDELSSAEYLTFLKFDLPHISNLVKVNRATLYLSFHTGLDIKSDTLLLLPLTEDWDPKTITWNNQPAASFVGNREIIQSMPGSYVTVDIIHLTENWIANITKNYGILIKIKNPMNKTLISFASSKYSISSFRPKLVIEYTYKKAVK